MGLNPVHGKLTVLRNQMVIVQMEMVLWLPHLVGTHLEVQLLNSSLLDPILDVKMAISRKWEGCLLHRWTLLPYQKRKRCHLHLFVVLSLALLRRVKWFGMVCFAFSLALPSAFFFFLLLCYYPLCQPDMDYRQLMEKKRYISMIFIKMMNAGSSVVQGKKETFSLAVSKLQCCFLTENSIC
jgi:hypothetical protein